MKSRYIPLHILSQTLGSTTCSAISKAHILLTGCDVTNKVGMKPPALKNNREKYLQHFGKEALQSSFKDAEKHLVKTSC